MKDVFTAILDYYNDDSTLSGLASLYRYRADNEARPYVVMHLVSGNPSINFASYDISEKPYIQFSIWADTAAEADAILDALTSRFDNATLTYSGSFCLRQNVVGDVDEESVWYYHVDYLIDNQ